MDGPYSISRVPPTTPRRPPETPNDPPAQNLGVATPNPQDWCLWCQTLRSC